MAKMFQRTGMLSAAILLLSISLALAIADQNWWKHAVFYQIYPRSFKDSNNDGIGDLAGIIDKLDHLVSLGVDAVWLSPIFPSPQIDQGYDISDYLDIDPDYGTLEDMSKLIEEAHKLGIKVILDFVPNHTSDQHQWFINSVNNVEEYKDYYIWVDAVKDNGTGKNSPPNNWISIFKGSAWTWSEKRQQYYLHQFAEAQPDLNYNNKAVVEAMKNILIFWLDRGIDGFRVDAVPYLFEDKLLPNEPLSNLSGISNRYYEHLTHIYTKDQPDTFEMIYYWRKVIDQYTIKKGGYQRILMTEAYTDINKTMLYFGNADGSKLGGHFTFNFNLITDIYINSTAQDIVDCIQKWLNAIPKIYTSNWVLGNHDNARVATRFGKDNVDGFNMLLTILPGVGVTYNGEEIGLEDGEVAFAEGHDPNAKDPATFDKQSRDFERTPYHWDNSVNAGFNNGTKPWLPVSRKYLETNLKNQLNSPFSHYHVYREMIALRRDDVLVSGETMVKAVGVNSVLVERRHAKSNQAYALVFNKGDDPEVVDVSDYVPERNFVKVKSAGSKHEIIKSINPKMLSLEAHESLLIYYTAAK